MLSAGVRWFDRMKTILLIAIMIATFVVVIVPINALHNAAHRLPWHAVDTR